MNRCDRRIFPAPLGAGGVGSIPANSDAQNVPSFRRWRFEMKLSPFFCDRRIMTDHHDAEIRGGRRRADLFRAAPIGLLVSISLAPFRWRGLSCQQRGLVPVS